MPADSCWYANLYRARYPEMRVAFLILALVLGGCQKSAIGEAQEAMSAQLLDPGAAQFRNMKALDGDRVCGEVNGKNAFGAYTGYDPFAAVRNDDGTMLAVAYDSDEWYEIPYDTRTAVEETIFPIFKHCFPKDVRFVTQSERNASKDRTSKLDRENNSFEKQAESESDDKEDYYIDEQGILRTPQAELTGQGGTRTRSELRTKCAEGEQWACEALSGMPEGADVLQF